MQIYVLVERKEIIKIQTCYNSIKPGWRGGGWRAGVSVCLNKNISTCSCKSNKVKYSDGGFFAIKVCSKFIKSILWNWTFNLLLMLRITSYNSGNQRGFRWWRYLKLFWTLLDFVYFENSEFSCHLRTVQLCYYVITDKTISVNSWSIFIGANSRLLFIVRSDIIKGFQICSSEKSTNCCSPAQNVRIHIILIFFWNKGSNLFKISNECISETVFAHLKRYKEM